MPPLSLSELADQYLAEVRHLEALIQKAKLEPNPNPIEQDKRIQTLQTMLTENYQTYRYLLLYYADKDK